VSRYSYTNGNALIELGERNLSGVSVEEFKIFVSSMKDVRRPLFKNESEARSRWYDCIATTNKTQYNVDTDNLRDWGIGVGKNGKMIDTDKFLGLRDKIFGWAVWNVKHGMSAAPDTSLRQIAITYQQERIEYSDIMEILEPVFAFAHLDDKDYNGEAIKGVVSEAKGISIIEKYQVSYRDDRNYGWVYVISNSGLRNFINDYCNFLKNYRIPRSKPNIVDAVRKLKWIKMLPKETMHVPALDTVSEVIIYQLIIAQK
jgi:hypothetical protein